MSLDFEQLRQKLAEDRETCGNSSLAQKYLNECEQIQGELIAANPDAVLSICAEGEKRIGTDSVTSLELQSMAADLSRWDEEIDAIPATEHGSASYRAALECFRILKRNYVALLHRNELKAAEKPEPDPELEKVFSIIGDGWRDLVRKPQHGDEN
jgi:hypothetical protein